MTTKFIVHYEIYEDGKTHTMTYRKLESAVEFLEERRNSLEDCFKNNSMCFHDGSPIMRDTLDFILERQCYIEKQVITSERLEY